MLDNMSEPLRGGSGDRGGDSGGGGDGEAAAGWQLVRGGQGRSPVRRTLPGPCAGLAVGGSRFWALDAEGSDSEDEVEAGVHAAPAGPKVSDFIAFAEEVSVGGGRRRRFAPGGGGTRAVAARIWQPPSSSPSSGDSAGAAAGAIRARAAASLAALVADAGSSEEWPCLPSLPPSGASVVTAAAAAGDGDDRAARSGSPLPRVGPSGPGAQLAPAGPLGLAGPSGVAGVVSLSGPRVDAGARAAGPEVVREPRMKRGYLWVRKGCPDPLLGFPAAVREVRRLTHTARSIRLLSPPLHFLCGGGDGRPESGQASDGGGGCGG